MLSAQPKCWEYRPSAPGNLFYSPNGHSKKTLNSGRFATRRQMPRKNLRHAEAKGSDRNAVFLNVPYDEQFKDLFLAYMVGVRAYGLIPRATIELLCGSPCPKAHSVAADYPSGISNYHELPYYPPLFLSLYR